MVGPALSIFGAPADASAMETPFISSALFRAVLQQGPLRGVFLSDRRQDLVCSLCTDCAVHSACMILSTYCHYCKAQHYLTNGDVEAEGW